MIGGDNLGQVNYTFSGDPNVHQDETWYAANGNLDDDPNGTADEIVTGDFNRLAKDENYEYWYDKEGNLILRESDTESTAYEWDHRNRLTQVATITTATGELVYQADYQYDVFDRRIGRTFYKPSYLSPAEDYYVHDGSHVAKLKGT